MFRKKSEKSSFQINVLFCLMAWILHYLYSLHADFYTSENIINIEI